MKYSGRFSKARRTQLNMAKKNTIYDILVKDIKGVDIRMDAFKGKKIIIMNVASKCGFTSQYSNWEDFYLRNNDKIVILGFPSNDFGNQELDTNTQIESFCVSNYGITFPMFEKISVIGFDKHSLYEWLTNKKLNGWNTQEPVWNFCKYLINEKGDLQCFFTPDITPCDDTFLNKIFPSK